MSANRTMGVKNLVRDVLAKAFRGELVEKEK